MPVEETSRIDQSSLAFEECKRLDGITSDDVVEGQVRLTNGGRFEFRIEGEIIAVEVISITFLIVVDLDNVFAMDVLVV